MPMLIAGVALWWLAHLWKRIAPGGDANRRKLAVTAALVLSLVLMTWGYRTAEGPVWWGASAALKGINNLLVLAAFYLFAASGAKSALGTRLRDPQLIGFSLWAGAHLLVNGDLPSLVLFGGLLAWALVEMAVLTAAGVRAPAPTPVRAGREAGVALAALVLYALVGLVHGWIGPSPFGA